MDGEVTPYNVKLSDEAASRRDILLSNFKKELACHSQKLRQCTYMFELQVAQNDDRSLTYFIELPGKIERTSILVSEEEWKLRSEVEKDYAEEHSGGLLPAAN